MRQYQQIPARVRYFIALSSSPDTPTTNPVLTDRDAAMVWIPQGLVTSTQYVDGDLESVFETTSPLASAVYITQGLLLKDLGRQFYVYNTLGADAVLQCIFRQVEKQQSILTEGNIPYNSATPAANQNVVWIKVWQADSLANTDQQIFFARTG